MPPKPVVCSGTDLIGASPAALEIRELVRQLARQNPRCGGTAVSRVSSSASGIVPARRPVRLTKMVVEDALEGELDDHLGYARHDPGKPR
jgi:hypothetical protein